MFILSIFLQVDATSSESEAHRQRQQGDRESNGRGGYGGARGSSSARNGRDDATNEWQRKRCTEGQSTLAFLDCSGVGDTRDRSKDGEDGETHDDWTAFRWRYDLE
ncbi:hypothetical protein BDW22DRAFT_1358080 [Trametopsis cervina]|nr:hypothetical protein BDW22DRAFT_1358080 [Trametopsis cervina]